MPLKITLDRRSSIFLFWFAGIMVVPIIAHVGVTFLGLFTAAVLFLEGSVGETLSNVIAGILFGISYLFSALLWWWLWKRFNRPVVSEHENGQGTL